MDEYGKGKNGLAINFGSYRLDVGNEQLWRESQLIRLTPKAWQVLRLLVERSGQLVTKDEFAQTVWAGTVVSDAALTSCIQELRQALEDNARTPQYIETVHRRGFRFIGKVDSEQLAVVSQEEERRQNSNGKSQKAKVKETEQAAGLMTLPRVSISWRWLLGT